MSTPLVRFYKPSAHETLPLQALQLSTPEKKAYKEAVENDPDHWCALSFFNLLLAELHEARAAYDCLRGRDDPRDSWSLDFDELRAVLEERLPPEILAKLRWEVEPVVGSPECEQLPGSKAHVGVYGLAEHSKNSVETRNWIRLIQTHALPLFQREVASSATT